MSAPNSLTPDKLFRLISRPDTPALIDVRTDEDAAADPRLVPGARRLAAEAVATWAPAFAGRGAVVICAEGHARSEGVAAWLRSAGSRARGRPWAWRAAGLPRVPEAAIPRRSADGATLWVTRARPKIDRIACPWLIRRFVDPAARFLYVAPAEVTAVAERFDATPFDVEADIFWTHLEQLEAGMLLYDAFYRWCRDATGETHNWPSARSAP